MLDNNGSLVVYPFYENQVRSISRRRSYLIDDFLKFYSYPPSETDSEYVISLLTGLSGLGFSSRWIFAHLRYSDPTQPEWVEWVEIDGNFFVSNTSILGKYAPALVIELRS